jgi:hypothetical protein
MNNWLYNNKEITDITQFSSSIHGFIYKVTHIPSGKSYIGKKVLYFNKKVKLGKKELALHSGPGRKPTTKLTVTESDWKTYYGSEIEIKKILAEGKHNEFERVILKLVGSKKLLTYFEMKYQFMYEVLEYPDKWYNNNILGKFYSKDFLDSQE